MNMPYTPGLWVNTFPAEIMVCDPQGVILEMSETAIALYQRSGGAQMIGRNVFDHHKEPSRSQVRDIIARRETMIYTTEKGGQKKLVCISPWQKAGEYAGFVLLVLDLPAEMMNICKD